MVGSPSDIWGYVQVSKRGVKVSPFVVQGQSALLSNSNVCHSIIFVKRFLLISIVVSIVGILSEAFPFPYGFVVT